MVVQLVCPRCGARDSFITGFLPETCMCRVCQSQLDWQEIPGCGPDCKAVEPDPPPPPAAPTYVKATAPPTESAAQGETAEATEPSESGGTGPSRSEDVHPVREDSPGEARGDGGR